MTIVKICGVTRADDAARIAEAGADYLGLNFWPGSKRYLAPARAASVAAAARAAGAIRIVGLFVDATLDDIVAVATQVDLDVIQLHGDDDRARFAAVTSAIARPVWKALSVGAASDVAHLDAWPVEAVLLDTPSAGRGGSGQTFDWTLADSARRAFPAIRVMLAGGLDAANVGAAIATVSPWGVDVASGVEMSPGLKDPAKIAAFVAAVRAADHRG